MKIKNREMESACLTELEITVKGEAVARMRLYWSAKSGVYGYQIGAEFWTDFKPDSGYTYSEYITGGCGYCKESQAFDQFIRLATNGKCYGGSGTVDWFFGRGKKYHKGGNFYSVPLSVLIKTFKPKKGR